ncbi:hypothetical protein SIN_02877 [Salmonella enterica subsp. enterica serovar Infantis]|nr:hypothetical protein SIN_02877 [Salmonella enterica subsp. enterica serovar Infantis]
MFPAPAGINRRRRPAAPVAVRVPRASGDKPGVLFDLKKWIVCSPR